MLGSITCQGDLRRQQSPQAINQNMNDIGYQSIMMIPAIDSTTGIYRQAGTQTDNNKCQISNFSRYWYPSSSASD